MDSSIYTNEVNRYTIKLFLHPPSPVKLGTIPCPQNVRQVQFDHLLFGFGRCSIKQ